MNPETMTVEQLDMHIADLERQKDELKVKTVEAVQVRKNLLADQHLRQKLSKLKLSEDELVKMGLSPDKIKELGVMVTNDNPVNQVATPLPVEVGSATKGPKVKK